VKSCRWKIYRRLLFLPAWIRRLGAGLQVVINISGTSSRLVILLYLCWYKKTWPTALKDELYFAFFYLQNKYISLSKPNQALANYALYNLHNSSFINKKYYAIKEKMLLPYIHKVLLFFLLLDILKHIVNYIITQQEFRCAYNHSTNIRYLDSVCRPSL
jgi:hypothetical protein